MSCKPRSHTKSKVELRSGTEVLFAVVAMAVKVSKVWPVEKYARFISDSQQAVLLQRDVKKGGGGVWQVS